MLKNPKTPNTRQNFHLLCLEIVFHKDIFTYSFRAASEPQVAAVSREFLSKARWFINALVPTGRFYLYL